MTALNALDMIDLLKQGTLQPQAVLEGMVKPTESSSSCTFLFSAGSGCNGWIEIDAASVESVEVLGNSKCEDHTHPFVRLTMKPAVRSDKQATNLFSLVTHLHSELRAARGVPPYDPDGPDPRVCARKPWLC